MKLVVGRRRTGRDGSLSANWPTSCSCECRTAGTLALEPGVDALVQHGGPEWVDSMQTDAGDTVVDETEIEIRDVTQSLMPPPHSFTERVCLAIRWAGIFLSTTALGLVRPAFQ